jgi:Fe-S cluster assembly iron-binding protein IscA
MLTVTSEATRHLIEVRRQRGVGDDAGARFISKGGQVGLTFAATPADGDRVVDGTDIPVFVAADIADVLDESIIDARDENGQMTLILRRRPTERKQGPAQRN